MDAESKQIVDLKAEIERLKNDHAIVRRFLDKADARVLSYEQLIIKLADTLEEVWATGAVGTGVPPLIRQAREITE